ncbi:hypothetical protein BCR32DRAFT_291564 [Anaeromyces robustus]|uniref:Uncharacterized protein n=1 Tax=Anaeromyces robustus TaxID=1754192 RepID=A0A1Y1XEA3_9FUNG|nr:hypothetical protein BCR32DRAFT_291564 [Anaeromyces robustus]|eukprot:ORX84069.1 hypothetical protein BCR32DRAFT_291564 [Anaeromyces robustus]
MSGINENDWETCYSDDDDYVENMKNLKIESSGVKMKKGKTSKELEKEKQETTTQHIIVNSFDGQNIINDDHSIDESSIANYSIDYSMISEMNDFSFLTNSQNLAVLLNNNKGNTLEDEINGAIDREALINPDTSLIVKPFINTNEEPSDLSSLLSPSVQNNNNSLISNEPELTEGTNAILPDKSINSEENSNVDANGNFNPMFINRISSFPIVQQSVQAIKSTTIGNLADRTIRRVASTRLPVISVPKLPTIPLIAGKNKNKENEDSNELAHSNSITIEDATKNIPGLATVDSIGCKTLDKLEENFPMINDPNLLDKILNRLEELREIGENTYVVQSSLNSLQNMQNRLNRYNSVIIKRNNSINDNEPRSPLKHRHSFSVATIKKSLATSTFHEDLKNKNFTATQTFETVTASTANSCVKTESGCCCCCKCHQQNKDSIIEQKIRQQQKNLINSTINNKGTKESSKQEKSEKANFFLRRSQKPGIYKEIMNIRESLQENINAIPKVMYGRISNVLNVIEKKLLSGTELEREIALSQNNNANQIINNDQLNEMNHSVLKDTNKISAEPACYTGPQNSSLKATITTTTTTSTSTTSTVTTTMTTNINHQREDSIGQDHVSSPLFSSTNHHHRMRSSISDYETDSTLYSPLLSASSFSLGGIPTINAVKNAIAMKGQDLSTNSNINNSDGNNGCNHSSNYNNGGNNVHDLYSFLEEVNKLLSIYLITRKKNNENVVTTSTQS